MTHNDISDAEIEAVRRAGLALPFLVHVGSNSIRSLILASRAALLAEGRKVVAREALIEMCDAATLSTSAFLALENQGIRGAELRRLKHAIRFRAMWDVAP